MKTVAAPALTPSEVLRLFRSIDFDAMRAENEQPGSVNPESLARANAALELIDFDFVRAETARFKRGITLYELLTQRQKGELTREEFETQAGMSEPDAETLLLALQVECRVTALH